MTIQSNSDQVILRIADRIKRSHPDSEAMRVAFTKIGILLSSQIALNIRKKGLIDTGRLLNSIRYEFYKNGDISGIEVGSYGVPYAGVQEYGYNGPVRAHQRLIRKVFGKPLKEPKKIDIRSYNLRIQPKYFMTEAVKRHQNSVIDMLRSALSD